MKKDSFEKKLAGYVAMAAAYLAANPVDANAQIMYTDVNPDTSFYQTPYFLDLNNDGILDLQFKHNEGSSMTGTTSVGCVTHWGYEKAFGIGLTRKIVANQVQGCQGNPIPLGYGDEIGNGNGNVFGNGGILGSYSVNGCWSGGSGTSSTGFSIGCFNGADEYIGLRINNGGHNYYGWARISGLTIKDYAVNMMPDSSIAAGETGGHCSIPQISTTPTGVVVFCNDSVLIHVFNSTGFNVQWVKDGQTISGATDSVYMASESGIYNVLISDSNCVVGINAIHFDTSYIAIGESHIDETCNDANGNINISITGNSPGYNYYWNNGSTTQNLSGISSGVYDLTVTSNGCPDTASASIEIFNFPGPILSETHTDSVCNIDGSIYLMVIGGTYPFTYHWNNNHTTQDLSGIAPGNYSVTVYDANNCSAYESVSIINSGQLLSQTHSTTCDSTAFIDLTVSGGTPPYSYQWTNGSTQQDLNNLPQGTWAVLVTDNNGCNTTVSVNINSGPGLNPPVIFNGNTISTVSEFISYQWFFNNSPIAGATDQEYLVTQVGYYKVQVSDTNGCSGFSGAIYLSPNSNNEMFSSEKDVSFEVINKILLFHLPDNSLLGEQIEIINELGQLVTTVTVSNQNPEADLSALPGGIYFFHISSKQKTYSSKFFIE